MLQVIGDFIRSNLPPQFSISITLRQRPTVPPPHHTNQSEARHRVVHGVTMQQRELWLFELTISYESVVADAKERKRAKYHNLVEAV